MLQGACMIFACTVKYVINIDKNITSHYHTHEAFSTQVSCYLVIYIHPHVQHQQGILHNLCCGSTQLQLARGHRQAPET